MVIGDGNSSPFPDMRRDEKRAALFALEIVAGRRMAPFGVNGAYGLLDRKHGQCRSYALIDFVGLGQRTEMDLSYLEERYGG